jgi:hypothetical protein
MVETVIAALFFLGVGYSALRWFAKDPGLNSEWSR